jgi:hypothetical protein
MGAEMGEQMPNPTKVRVVPVDPTAEPDNVETRIVFPRPDEVKSEQPINIQLRTEGFAVGNDTEVPREKEIWNDPEGQSWHVFIDNHPYFAVNQSAIIDALDDMDANWYEQTLEFEIPFDVAPGEHVIRTFPVRSFNESLKGDGCYAARRFFFQTTTPTLDVDLHAPYLTYNEPQDDYNFSSAQPILLDFYLSNCQLSKDGYKVRLSIDGAVQRDLVAWVPYYLYGLSRGRHTIRLELLDPENKRVPGLFNDVQRVIEVR